MAAVLMFAACTKEGDTVVCSEGAVFKPELRIAVSEMNMSASSRALAPMSPDVEKYVRSIAIFEFDNEGVHDKRSTTYHFIDFLAGTVDGVESDDDDVRKTEFGIVETTLKGLAFEARSEGTICLVANVDESQVFDFYNNDMYHEPGQSHDRINLANFQKWALKFDYYETENGVYDETQSGHLQNMYMFGYYYGKIDPSNPEAIMVDLGRLASRIDITVINKTGEEIRKRLGYHFDNVCKYAFFFPMKMSVPVVDEVSRSRTVICSGYKDDDTTVDPVDGAVTEVKPSFGIDESHTRYFYVAAHSATGLEQATKLHLFYNRRILDDAGLKDDEVSGVKIPLCNVPPEQAAGVVNGYSLSRNTRYHFTIRLVKKKDAASASRVGAVSPDVVEERPGEITVYLP